MTITETRPTAGRTVELASYQSDTGPRRIVGQRLDGAVQLRDEPADGAGHTFVIEDRLHAKAEMDAILADYLKRAHQLGYIPMFSLGWRPTEICRHRPDSNPADSALPAPARHNQSVGIVPLMWTST